MPYNIVVGDILRCSIYNHAVNQIGINNVHYLCTGTTGLGSDIDEAAHDLYDLYQPVYSDLCSTASYFLGIKLATRNVTPTPRAGLWEAAVANAGGAGIIPSQVAGVLSLYTDFAGRAGRGRLYTPFVAPGSVTTGDLPTAAYRGFLGDLGNAVIGGITVGGGGNTSDLIACIVNKDVTHAWDIITHFANNRFGTIRKRGQYGKANADAI